MDVQPCQIEPFRSKRVLHGPFQVRQRHAELAVLLRRLDGLVRVRLDARRDADEDRLPLAAQRAEALQTFQLVLAVDDDSARAPFEAGRQERFGLGVAVQRHALHREACQMGQVQLALGHRVEPQPLFADQLGHGDVQKRLAGVADARVSSLHGFSQTAAAPAHHALVHHVQRRAVFVGQPDCVAAAPDQMIAHFLLPPAQLKKRASLCIIANTQGRAKNVRTRYHPAWMRIRQAGDGSRGCKKTRPCETVGTSLNVSARGTTLLGRASRIPLGPFDGGQFGQRTPAQRAFPPQLPGPCRKTGARKPFQPRGSLSGSVLCCFAGSGSSPLSAYQIVA